MTSSQRFLLLTVDYEIFGNGSGDVRLHVTEPAERMARLCERYQVPLTVFVETEELVAFECYNDVLHRDLGYAPADLINQQIASLASRGHDIQLHLHPEWLDARYENLQWLLRPERGTVDSLFETGEQTEKYIADRKSRLESISGQRVLAYRAGAFSAQPGRKLLRALELNQIAIDSSVVKGLVRDDKHAAFDYRKAPDKAAWRVAEDVALEDPNGSIWEVPIHSVRRRRFQQATWRRLRAKFSRHIPRERQADTMKQFGIPGNTGQFLKQLGQHIPVKMDFHNVSPRALLRWTKSAPEPSPGLPDVLVMIGHTKEHIDDTSFENLLRLISADSSLKVVTFGAIANLLPAVLPRIESQAKRDYRSKPAAKA